MRKHLDKGVPRAERNCARGHVRGNRGRAAEKFWVTFWFRFEGALVSPSTCEVAPHGMTVLAHSQLVTDRGMNSGGGGVFLGLGLSFLRVSKESGLTKELGRSHIKKHQLFRKSFA